ncbi:hypothetical protein WK81_24490 [Burkholderia ubonensis]|nr:hypothetical protein WK81_24490 [Burkholderia ubonensis]
MRCFLLEGLPTMAVGVLCYRFMCDTPDQAQWRDHRQEAYRLRGAAAPGCRHVFRSDGRQERRAYIVPSTLIVACALWVTT